MKSPAVSNKLTIVRHSSSIQSPAGPGPSSSGTNAAAFTLPEDRLDWNTFFKLRKTRRRLQLGTSVATAVASMGGGAQALALSDMDAIVEQIPLDPFTSLGLITFACGGIGWLMGPIVGTGIFNMMNKKYISQMATVSFDQGLAEVSDS
jgi:import inner membrane translocase subunit TIM23